MGLTRDHPIPGVTDPSALCVLISCGSLMQAGAPAVSVGSLQPCLQQLHPAGQQSRVLSGCPLGSEGRSLLPGQRLQSLTQVLPWAERACVTTSLVDPSLSVSCSVMCPFSGTEVDRLAVAIQQGRSIDEGSMPEQRQSTDVPCCSALLYLESPAS